MPAKYYQYPEVEISVPRFEDHGLSPRYYAGMDFHQNLSPLFPYINGKLPDAKMWTDPPMLLLPLLDWNVRLHPYHAVSGPFNEKEQAYDLVHKLIKTLNDIHERRDEITPCHGYYNYSSPLDVLKLLPRSNCGKCGWKTCIAFASFVSRSRADIHECPYIVDPIATKMVYPVFDRSGKVVSMVEMVEVDTDSRSVSNGNRVSEFPPPTVDETSSGPVDWPFPETRRLTKREVQVLSLVAEGLTNKEICQTLEISPHTVKSHVDHIFNKLGVFDRTQAAVVAVRKNIIP